MAKRIKDAYELFEDISELFEEEKKRIYLMSVLTKDEIDSLIEEFLVCFSENDDTEKVSTINRWKSLLNVQKN